MAANIEFNRFRLLGAVGVLLSLGLGACASDDGNGVEPVGTLPPTTMTPAPVMPAPVTPPATAAGAPTSPTSPAPTAPSMPAPTTPTATPAPTTPTPAPTMPPAAPPMMMPAAAPGSFPAVTEFGAPGPFVPGERVVEGPDCTFYTPTNMGLEGRKHPVVIWGNGTGGSNTSYQEAHLQLATHGFIIAAANTANSGSGTEMIACLDFLAEESAKTEGKYAGKVDLTRVASSGHSQGGCAVFMAGRDMRVTSLAPVEPYVQIDLGGCQYDAAIAQQHAPMFMMSGTEDTVAVPAQNQAVIFGDATTPVFWGTREGADHINAATGTMPGFLLALTAWFRYTLMNDQMAAKMFVGADCGLCTNTQEWMVQKKMFQ